MQNQMFEVQIPFAGFYCSIHSDEVTQPLERLPDHWREYMPCDIPQKLMDMFERSADYQNAFEEYARDYAQGFINEYLECRGVYSGMQSPRFYNFETDRLFVKVPRHEIARLWRKTDKAILDRITAERFTSRDGFRSFYIPNWREWGRLSTWDHNQLGTLLLAYLETERGEEWDCWAEFALMEDASGNGYLDEWLFGNPNAERPWRIFNYMIERQQRAGVA